MTIPATIGRCPAQDDRTRLFTQQVQTVLNAIILSGAIVPSGVGTSRFVQPYSPAVPANWTGTAPTTVGEALDRIAACLSGLPL